jgi:2-polyprenyl-3-methyl-5-hydroxy-6-metoxy-1,4-benzoquinol methylase
VTYSFEAREECPACSAGGTATVYSAPFSEGGIGTFMRNFYKVDPNVLDQAPYELRHCRRCDLVYQAYVGGPELLADVYTKWCWQPADPDVDYAGYKEHVSEYRLSPPGHEVMTVSSYLNLPYERIKVLDYGMGWGMYIRVAKQLGCDAYGVELSQPQVEYARSHGIKTLTDDELGEPRFHFINTEQVFEHVTRPLDLLKRLGSSLLPGGVVKVSVPSAERASQIVDLLKSGQYRGDHATIMPVQPLEHVNSFKRRTLRTMSDLTGLKPVQPNWLQWYSFLGQGGISLQRPKKALKELARPPHTRFSRSNIYMWLRKPG